VQLVAPAIARADALPNASSSPADEDPSLDPPAEPAPAPKGHLTLGIGGFSTSEQNGGAILDVLGLGRVGLLAFGLDVQVSYGGGDSSAAFAPTLGVLASSRFSDVGIVGMVGVRNHEVRDANLLSADPGATGMTGMFAVRAIAMARAGHFSIGPTFFLDDDLARMTSPTYTFTQPGLFGGSAQETRSHRIGTLRFGGLLSLGATF
jgi:hypothetical protein